MAIDEVHDRPGSLSAAFSHTAFRWVFSGSFASNIGTWMQNFTLGALADQLTGKSWFIGLVTFAQLGPTLFLSPLAGVLADTFDRRKLMVAAATMQTFLSFGLAVLVLNGRPNELALVLLVGAIGVAGAANAPAANATLPALVGRKDLSGAIALNSAQMNLSRVVGPLIAGLIIGLDHPAVIFGINAATYIFVIIAVIVAPFDARPTGDNSDPPLQRLREGFVAAAADRVITRVLVTVSVYSFCSLIFIYQLAPFARKNLHGDSHTFTLVFSSFGFGAAVGAIAVGTFLIRVHRSALTRWGLVGFAISLTLMSIQHSVGPAMAAAFFTGVFYFTVITALSTVLQERVNDEVRGRVMGLWMMGWAGLVPLGSLIGGPIIDLSGLTRVFIFGAVVSLGLAWYADLRAPDDDGPLSAPIEPLLE